MKAETKNLTPKFSSIILSANLNKEASIGELITLPDLLILSCCSFYVMNSEDC